MDQQTQQNLLDLVKNNYEEIADDFDASRKKTLWPELVRLAGPVKDGDKILDAGCGNGRLLAAFAGKKINYLGVDGSRKLIEAAEENLRVVIARNEAKRNEHRSLSADWRIGTGSAISQTAKQDMPEIASLPTVARNDSNNYKFIIGDILELDKISEKDFDYVFCVAVLHHLPGENLKLEALSQLKNKMKPGGKVIITVWNLWHKQKYRKLICKFAISKILGKNKMDFGDILFNWKNSQAQSVSQRYYHVFTKGELKEIAIRAGFKINKLYKDKYNYYLILENK